jgi:hypothetical protein
MKGLVSTASWIKSLIYYSYFMNFIIKGLIGINYLRKLVLFYKFLEIAIMNDGHFSIAISINALSL